MGESASRQNVTLKGENALSGSRGSAGSPTTVGWSHIRDAFSSRLGYSGLTVLRMSDVVVSGSTARREFEGFLRDFH